MGGAVDLQARILRCNDTDVPGARSLPSKTMRWESKLSAFNVFDSVQ